jgi:hypothetical protein
MSRALALVVGPVAGQWRQRVAILDLMNRGKVVLPFSCVEPVIQIRV